MIVFDSTADLTDHVGTHLGSSPWVTMDHRHIRGFGEATHDFNWIHFDAERAAASPFGSIIAHGYHTLALIGGLIQQTIDTSFCSVGLNYGLDRVRFPAAVPVDSRVRLDLHLTDTVPFDGGVDAVYRCVIEIEDGDKPACVAEVIFRYYD